MKVPARSDRAYFSPPGHVTVYESNLRAGLRFPPSPELIDILTICGVSLSQFSYRAMSIVMSLIVLFRDRGVVLSAECLSRMGRLFSDVHGQISFRSKWLDIRTQDLSKIIEEFKKSYAFKIIIEDHVQEARNLIYDVEVKALEAECIEDGFIRGFMKGVRDVQRKTGAEIEGLTPSQAYGDPSSDSGGEELESELQYAFSLEENEDDIEIL
ncbi:hypothetical protein IEQ34_019105 [Dendrobium chrysotoxum]|uniref:Uncharacterized protein n=1 Tax=Dendrobium chrysotoxum TaxID=161865 RepID=A0AAV7G6H4_DENCH|nr:hypothetical protein IEQ34_019105 [Dendrobium chrysotoxum]